MNSMACTLGERPSPCLALYAAHDYDGHGTGVGEACRVVSRWPRTSRLAAPLGVSRGSYPNPGGVRALPPLGKMEEAGAIRRSPQLRAGDDFIYELL